MNVGSVELLGSIDTIQIRYDTHTHANTAKFKIIWHKLLYDNEKMYHLLLIIATWSQRPKNLTSVVF